MPVATPIAATHDQLGLVQYDDAGLVPAIVQEDGTGTVLMMAWMNAETLRMRLEGGRTVFWSRSRQEVWRKGDTSGDRQFVRQAFYDCDGDNLLFVVEQEGKGACNTGARSCFFRASGDAPPETRGVPGPGPRAHGHPRLARGAGRPQHDALSEGLRLPSARLPARTTGQGGVASSRQLLHHGDR